MLKIVRLLVGMRRILCLLCATGLLSLPLLGADQKVNAAPPAPVPSQIAAAKKVFIANAPGIDLPKGAGGQDRTYNEFYAAMKSWGRYDLVTIPADADIVFEICYTNQADIRFPNLLRLVIVDPKSHVPLWWLLEYVEPKTSFGHHPETYDSAFVRTIGMVIADVKSLVGQAPVVIDTTKN